MPRTHGLRATYVAGCRCDKCREASRAYNATRASRITDLKPIHKERLQAEQKASQASATRTHRPWETWEDDLAADYSQPVLEIARQLGRTASSVRNRRAVKKLRARWYAARVLKGGEQL